MKTTLFPAVTVPSETRISREPRLIHRDLPHRLCASLALPLLLVLPAAVQAQFDYLTNNGTITITAYTGPGGAVTIPSTTNEMSVTSIGNEAFSDCFTLTSVNIPDTVTNIGSYAFHRCLSLTNVIMGNGPTTIGSNAFDYCSSLTEVAIPSSVTSIGDAAFGACASLGAITVNAGNSWYSSVGGVLFNKGRTTLIAYPGGLTGSYGISNSVTSIGDWAFWWCSSLTGITIPNSTTNIGVRAFSHCGNLSDVTIGNNVTSIGSYGFYNCYSLARVTIPNKVINIGGYAFSFCTSLTAVYFRGNAPPGVGLAVFENDDEATVYYLPETTGWTPWFADRPTVLWNPQVQTSDASFGLGPSGFGFTIKGTSNLVVVVEASDDLANPSWSPLGTNTLTGGSSYFSDPEWANHRSRFYRLRSP